MKILYVARHGSGGNDDEGAINFALEKLGHEVVRVRESHTKGVSNINADFLLCHHWHDLFALRQVKIPKVVWCFDLIDWSEPVARHEQRRRWARDITSICDLAFFTDGDWVAADKTGKAYWLTQGADKRPCEGTVEIEGSQIVKPVDILFVGGLGYGRETFVRELKERYGERFKHILKGCYDSALASEVNRAKIVVAPDSPVTDRYWSNRIYGVLRLGGFLLHPMSAGVCNQYPSDKTLKIYHSRQHLYELIEVYLKESKDKHREKIALTGLEYTLHYHLYRHRCASLVRTVKERLSI